MPHYSTITLKRFDLSDRSETRLLPFLLEPCWTHRPSLSLSIIGRLYYRATFASTCRCFNGLRFFQPAAPEQHSGTERTRVSQAPFVERLPLRRWIASRKFDKFFRANREATGCPNRGERRRRRMLYRTPALSADRKRQIGEVWTVGADERNRQKDRERRGGRVEGEGRDGCLGLGNL